VEQEKIRRLYTLDAKGIQDQELIDEVGYAFYARCESIRTVTEAHRGRARCPKCASIITHGWRKAEVLACECGWQLTWGEYLGSYQRKQLVGGAASPAFEEYLAKWPAARTYREKLLLVDALIHALHVDARRRFFRPAAVNVIEASMRDVNQLLDELAYGPQSTAGLAEGRASWKRALTEIGESMRAYWSARARR
jgi:hypothetical protein